MSDTDKGPGGAPTGRPGPPPGGDADPWAHEEREARPTTVGEGGARLWIYPDRRSGPRTRRRRLTAALLIAFYLVAPYVTVRGAPLLRFDVTTGRAAVLGMTFHPTDAPLLAFVLLLLALALFLATTLRGRIWCGYACPQTVFIDWVVRPIEELLEGSAHHRRVMDRGSWTAGLVARKMLKHALVLAVAAVVANTFLAYFVPAATLARWITSPPWEHPAGFAVMTFVLAVFYLDLAWFREQFCAFLCPYARFQAVLFDRDTPVPAYDTRRGEPRGKLKSTQRGDCIDCGLCVRVCPTGIDIRKGQQLECVACERCVDACDTIMDSVDRPRGLIRIASQRELEGGGKAGRGLRPRLVAYGALTAVVAVAFGVALLRRHDIRFALVRAPGSAYVATPDGRILNNFVLAVTNDGAVPISMRLEVASPAGASISCGACADPLPAADERHMNLVAFFPKDLPPTARTLVLLHEATGTLVEAPLLAP